MSNLTMEQRPSGLAGLLTCVLWLAGGLAAVAEEYPVLSVTTGGLGNTLLRSLEVDPKPAKAGSYRVRANGTGEALSDWSGTFWFR